MARKRDTPSIDNPQPLQPAAQMAANARLQSPRKVPLLLVLATLFISLNLVAVAAVGYLSTRNGDLRRFALLTADRELRIKELREENQALREDLREAGID